MYQHLFPNPVNIIPFRATTCLFQYFFRFVNPPMFFGLACHSIYCKIYIYIYILIIIVILLPFLKKHFGTVCLYPVYQTLAFWFTFEINYKDHDKDEISDIKLNQALSINDLIGESTTKTKYSTAESMVNYAYSHNFNMIRSSCHGSPALLDCLAPFNTACRFNLLLLLLFLARTCLHKHTRTHTIGGL